jgi:hypothetical protein
MRQCLGCKGLVPESSPTCPNCEVTAKGRGLLRSMVMATGTVAIIADGLACPAYGVPCTSKPDTCLDECSEVQADGGSPRNDPANTLCFTDGGSP